MDDGILFFPQKSHLFFLSKFFSYNQGWELVDASSAVKAFL